MACLYHLNFLCHLNSIFQFILFIPPYVGPKTACKEGDCHGPSGLAMTDFGAYLQCSVFPFALLVGAEKIKIPLL
jgi:hypothetical protein